MEIPKKKYRIFDYTWHIPHQYDMIYALRDHCEFSHCMNIKRQWDTSIRPVPENLKFVSHYEPDFYNAAILHIDQEVITPGHLKKRIYDEFNELITDVPKIVLNHGTPVCPELYSMLGHKHLSEAEMEKDCKTFVKSLVKGNTMVVNSHTAASKKEWDFGIPIIHGMNPDNWWDLPKEPRVFTAISPHGFDAYYNRKCMIRMSEELMEKHGYPLSFARVNVDTSNSPDDYRNYLGRSLLYIDTSYRTPMNRSRTEAFLSGCCVLQVEGAHDLERWAVHNENIIIVPNDPFEIAAIIANLLKNDYQKAITIGQNGKAMAMKHFNPDRYRNDWLNLFQQLIN